MLILARRHIRRASTVAVFALSAAFLAACAAPTPKPAGKKRPKEFFAESEYGVKASPRVTNKRSNLPRGGGRDQLGRPYTVRGKVYYPKEEKNYKVVGAASWYGDAFHGRLTANGEIYDMTHLTAAHPTMPLPSYARVTNTKNGNSVIVRVNDRGPYSDDRVIDLSRRAAEMLDYMNGGTADVKVEYVGRAPLDGQDDQFLLASFRPGNGAPDPSIGLPSGVMIAMNGPTPNSDVGPMVPVPTFSPMQPQLPTSGDLPFGQAVAVSSVILPDFGPIVPQRPTRPTQLALASMSYVAEAQSSAAAAFAAVDGTAGETQWKRGDQGTVSGPIAAYIAVGTFSRSDEAKQVARSLSAVGKATIERTRVKGASLYAVSLHADGRASLDAMLESAWANGAPDAFPVRD